jgi:hypothetical protein
VLHSILERAKSLAERFLSQLMGFEVSPSMIVMTSEKVSAMVIEIGLCLLA